MLKIQTRYRPIHWQYFSEYLLVYLSKAVGHRSSARPGLYNTVVSPKAEARPTYTARRIGLHGEKYNVNGNCNEAHATYLCLRTDDCSLMPFFRDSLFKWRWRILIRR